MKNLVINSVLVSITIMVVSLMAWAGQCIEANQIKDTLDKQYERLENEEDKMNSAREEYYNLMDKIDMLEEEIEQL